MILEKMIKLDDLITRLEYEVKRENELRTEIVDKILACDDPKKINELKETNAVHTVIINTLEAVIKIVNEQQVIKFYNNENSKEESNENS